MIRSRDTRKYRSILILLPYLFAIILTSGLTAALFLLKDIINPSIVALLYLLPVGIILADIDHFKSINDTHGHPWGDFVLSRFANIVVENKRAEDLVARYGGDEFIILPRGVVSQEILHAYCERIRQAVENFKFSFDSAPAGVTVSIGFHFKKIDRHDPETVVSDLIHHADQALYLAKTNGRNRTESVA